MKKLLSVLLAIVMIFSLFSVTSFAVQDKAVLTARATESTFSIKDFLENLIQSIDDFFAELFGAGKNLPDVSEWTDEEIINYYISAAKKSNEKAVSKEMMTVDYIDDGEEDSFYDSMEPLIKSMMAENVYEFDGITGDYEKITVDDCESVNAYKKGRYIIVDIVLKDQTDSMRNEEDIVNTISHGIGIIDDKQEFLDVLNEDGFTMDISAGDIVLDYHNAMISVRVNSDGYIKKGTWSYDIDVAVDNITLNFNNVDIPMNMNIGLAYKAKVGSIF